jgi:hypothetical protein
MLHMGILFLKFKKGVLHLNMHMELNEKENQIITLLNQGKSYHVINHEAKTSSTTIKKVKEKYEEIKAFELYAKRYSPARVKIEVGISTEDAAKYYLAYMKLVSLVDLFPIYYDLGDYLPDFVQFYKSAKSYNITPYNMNNILNLSTNTSLVQQENYNALASLQETRNFIATEKPILIEIRGDISRAQDTNLRLALKGKELQSEIELLNSVLDKIKNSPDSQKLNELIRETVNSITSDQSFALQVCLVAVMKLIQKDPTLIPLIQFPVPDDNDISAQTAMYQSVLIDLITKTTRLMPFVLEELANLTGKKVLPQIPNLEALIFSNSEFTSEQYNKETTSEIHTENHTELEVHSDVSKVSEVDPSVQDQKNGISTGHIAKSIASILAIA